jgi:hypothetical protein
MRLIDTACVGKYNSFHKPGRSNVSKSIFVGALIGLVLVLPQELNARGGGSQGGHNGVTVSKSNDKSSPKMMQQTTSNKTNSQPTKRKAAAKEKAIEVQDYGFGVTMPVTTSR